MHEHSWYFTMQPARWTATCGCGLAVTVETPMPGRSTWKWTLHGDLPPSDTTGKTAIGPRAPSWRDCGGLPTRRPDARERKRAPKKVLAPVPGRCAWGRTTTGASRLEALRALPYLGNLVGDEAVSFAVHGGSRLGVGGLH